MKYNFSFDSELCASFMKMVAMVAILSREKSKLSLRLLVLVWTNIVLDYVQNLVESMTNRMKQSKM